MYSIIPVRIFSGLCGLFLSLTLALTPAFAQQSSGGRQSFMLSFDDGPLPGRTDRVLKTLQQLRNQNDKPVKAAFFMVGDSPSSLSSRLYHAPFEIWAKGSMREYPEIVAAARKDGHYIGNHTAHHSWFHWPWLSSEEAMLHEIQAWEKAAKPELDQPKLFRPPYLHNNDRLTASARAQGYQVVLGYTVGDADPGNTLQDIKNRISKYLSQQPADGPPSVLIFHDTIAVTYENLGEIVRELQAQGYRLEDFDPTKLQNALPIVSEKTPDSPVASPSTPQALSAFGTGHSHD